MIFTFMGTISVITRAGILGKAVDRWGEVQLSHIGLIMLAAGLAAFPLMPTYVTLYLAVTLIPLGTAFTFPCVTSMLSRVISRNERGLYMGVQQTFGGLARVIVPLFAGYTYDHFGHSIPFLVSSGLVLIGFFVGLGIDDPRNPNRQADTAAAA